MSAETSPPTQSVPPFAQEIVDNIIDELSSDEDALKQCSTVSQSFYVPSRRHLFSSIDLDTIKTVVLFHRLLIRTPDIVRNVRMIEVGLRSHITYVDEEAGKEVAVTEWLATSTLLAEVLASLPCIETLVWHVSSEWDELSSDLRSALVKLFQCSLTTIDISSLDGFPLSDLHIVSPVKKLKLTSLWLDDHNKGQVILPRLDSEVLKLNDDRHISEGNRLVVPNLRHISVVEDNPFPSIAQEAINASGTSLQRLWWYHRLNQAAHISLNGLRCLQFLTVEITPSYKEATGFANWGRNSHIVSILMDTSLTQTLKDLTIGIESLHQNPIDTDLQDLYDSKIWKDLDIVLSSVSTLQRILIHVNFPLLDCIPAQLWAGMRESMPLLEERGILTFKCNRDAYPERDMWTDA